MLIYIFLIVIMLLLGIIMKPNSNKKNKKFYIFIVYGMLILVGALRNYTIGTDTAQYTNSYKVIKFINFSEYSKLRFEFGFFALCKILNYISESPQLLLIVTSFIIFGAVGIFVYKNSKDVIMSSILFVTLNYYGAYMSLMRQALAIAILVIAFECLKKKKNFKYILLVILASMFHQTALIMLFLIVIEKKEYKMKNVYIVILMSIIVFLFANTIFKIVIKIFPIYKSYEQSGFFESNYFASLINALVSLIILLTGIYCNFYKNNTLKKDDSIIAFIMSISYLLYVVTIKISIFVRSTTYFSYFSIIWLPNSILRIQDKKQQTVIKYIVFVFTLLYWLVIAKYRPEWHEVVPYMFFWKE